MNDDEPLPLQDGTEPNRCIACGKRLKAGFRKCKACRAAVKEELATRLTQQAKYATTEERHIHYLTMSNKRSFPHLFHILLLVVTLGLWTPVYIRSYYLWQQD